MRPATFVRTLSNRFLAWAHPRAANLTQSLQSASWTVPAGGSVDGWLHVS
jgi:hypothetical protein